MYAAPNWSALARVIWILLALSLVGVAPSASAAERIFADGFEPCCNLGGEVTSLTGSGLVLHLVAGVVNESKPVTANGGALRLYTFSHTVPTGTSYAVTIATQPSGQTCTLANGSGTMGSTSVYDINVNCGGGLIWDEGQWDDANWQ